MSDSTEQQSFGLLLAFLETGGLSEADAKNSVAWVQMWLRSRSTGLDEVFEVCESTMERMFLLGACAGHNPPFKLRKVYTYPTTALDLVSSTDGFVIHVLPQEELAFARLDFGVVLLGHPLVPELAIEIDGHDFHERTKEQAARDKHRDRRLAASGRLVFRFTGSEVFADANGCWVELHEAIKELVGRFTQFGEANEPDPALPEVSQ